MSFADDLVRAAEAEFADYGGMLETDEKLSKRIGEYWAERNKDYDGLDRDQPWSGVFISMMVRLADPRADFHFTARHASYIGRAIWNRATDGSKSFYGYQVGEVAIQPGDILGMNRGDQPRMTYEDATPQEAGAYPRYDSHGDIVVAVDEAGVHTIGGNVDHEVGRKVFVMDEHGVLVNSANSNQAVFVVVRRL